MQKESRRTTLPCGAIGAVAMLWAGLPMGSAAQAQVRTQERQPALSAGLPTVSLSGPCLRSGKAYLRASIRGAVRLDVDLRGAELTCEGGPRFNGGGILMSFEGSVGPQKRRLRMVFGIDGAQEGRPGKELPTNLTVIFEGEKQLFATQGNGNCTVDRLTQTHLSDRHSARAYRVVAHGFCIAPANDLAGHRRILVTTFDFAGRADFNAA
jgi:hypothetical protein